jgi:hypothetical protein
MAKIVAAELQSASALSYAQAPSAERLNATRAPDRCPDHRQRHVAVGHLTGKILAAKK